MKTKRLVCFAGKLVLLAAMVIPASCSNPNQVESKLPEAREQTQAVSMGHIADARADAKGSMLKVDMEVFYQNVLQQNGVSDFSAGSLIGLMDSDIEVVRYASAMLLGEKEEVSAIARLEEALEDESVIVRTGATTALLKMGNRSGIKTLEEFCEQASQELEVGDERNVVNQLDALKVLADAGEVSAIPHLRKLLRNESWGIRLSAVRSLSKLRTKDAAVLTDVALMAGDSHPQVREESSGILERIKANR
jgi:HEAT repeat protein